MQHFIVEFKNAFSTDFCDNLIAKFEKDENVTQGRIGSGVDRSKKNSIDLHLSTLAHWKNEHLSITNTMRQALTQYVRAYPHFLIGALSPSFIDNNTKKTKALTVEDIPQMSDESLSSVIGSIFCFDEINLQKYPQNSGNFNHWHSEHYPHPSDGAQKSLHRTLLWLVYLNDVEQGGETEFIYQQARIKPTKGSIVLSPCTFTHTHRGITPVSNDKYVLASWIMYKPAQQLYNTK
ncbi:2OG-Fe(II) oxygenase [Thalassotalea atypica]|uniref:2OG-Fe(II) oxygenase n=1 Tax=Thalassotalea atypica TaxID=2054316 RepID=UPI00257445A3|nr:2OG-Fe(II) oxygenase [Thalassotalea atypica]